MTEIAAQDRGTADQIRGLIEQAEGRVPLEALRDVYSRRLHNCASDFEATFGLRLVIAKLQRMPPRRSVVTRWS